MATKKVARSQKRGQPKGASIECSQQDGKTVARVRDPEGEYIAVVKGSPAFARAVASAFAAEWAAERARSQATLERHAAEMARIKRHRVEKATRAAESAAAAFLSARFGGAS